jgi:hypothetical protein
LGVQRRPLLLGDRAGLGDDLLRLGLRALQRLPLLREQPRRFFARLRRLRQLPLERLLSLAHRLQQEGPRAALQNQEQQPEDDERPDDQAAVHRQGAAATPFFGPGGDRRSGEERRREPCPRPHTRTSPCPA